MWWTGGIRKVKMEGGKKEEGAREGGRVGMGLTLCPRALRKVKTMPPPMTILSTLLMSVSITVILVETWREGEEKREEGREGGRVRNMT